MNPRARNTLLAMIAAGAVLPFLPALTAPFLEWDDALNLATNPHWRGFTASNVRWMLTTAYGGPYQPLAWLSCALDFTLWGANPAAMRMTNYLLHAASSVLFFLVVEELIRRASPDSAPRERRAAALFSALFWAAHPLRVESVVWLTERRDVLSGMFYLLAVHLYLRAPDKPLPPLFSYCLAVLSKASVITLPLTLILLDRWLLRRRSWADKIPYFAVSLAAGATAFAGQDSVGMLKGAESGAGERLAFGLYSMWWYAVKTAWPSGLSPFHQAPAGFGLGSPSAWGAALGVFALAAACWAVRRRAPAAAPAAAQYALALLPLAGFARFGRHLVAERYSYLPGLALAALAGAGLLAARKRAAWRTPASAAAAALVLACAGMTARGAGYWRSDEALWRRALEVDAKTSVASVNLASYLRRTGRADEALVQERLALAENPRLAIALINLGADAMAKKRWLEAEKLLRAAVAAEPESASAHYSLAAALGGQGRRAEELAELELAARLDFSDPRILNDLGVALYRAGRTDRAAAALRRAIELDPGMPEARRSLETVLAARKR